MSASPVPLDVELAPGAEDNGLAIMLSDLVRQNLEAKPHKRGDFDALAGSVAIVADDADVVLTMRFEAGGKMRIFDGIEGIPDVTIRGPADAILAMSNMPLATRFGLPIPRRDDPQELKTVRELFALIRSGRLHSYGALFHLPLVLRLTRVLSVNG
ncbi:MAG: hypothetical protein ACRENE_32285 [Polyangiaceae bacterium]